MRRVREEKSRSEKIREEKEWEARRCRCPIIWGSGGSKSNLAKAAGAEPAGQMRLHAVVARSTFVSKKAKNPARSDHFWKLRCRKSAHRWGAKHISKSKCTKHNMFGPLLEVEMSQRCTPVWREAHSKSKCTKQTMFGPLFDVQMSKRCTPVWREAHSQVKSVKN